MHTRAQMIVLEGAPAMAYALGACAATLVFIAMHEDWRRRPGDLVEFAVLWPTEILERATRWCFS